MSRPGTSGGDNKPTFHSPFQPPPGMADLLGDVAALDPTAYQVVHAADRFWQVKIPGADSLGIVAQIPELTGSEQAAAMHQFMIKLMHPQDLVRMLHMMADPDSHFGADEYLAVYRAMVTAGTARPFSRSSVSPALLRRIGAASERNSPSPVFRRRYARG